MALISTPQARKIPVIIILIYGFNKSHFLNLQNNVTSLQEMVGVKYLLSVENISLRKKRNGENIQDEKYS